MRESLKTRWLFFVRTYFVSHTYIHASDSIVHYASYKRTRWQQSIYSPRCKCALFTCTFGSVCALSNDLNYRQRLQSRFVYFSRLRRLSINYSRRCPRDTVLLRGSISRIVQIKPWHNAQIRSCLTHNKIEECT